MDAHQIKRVFHYPRASYTYNGGTTLTRHPATEAAPVTQLRHPDAETMSVEQMAMWLDTVEIKA